MNINTSSPDPMRIENILNPEENEPNNNVKVSNSSKVAKKVLDQADLNDLSLRAQKTLKSFAKDRHNCTDEQIAIVVNNHSRIKLTPKRCRELINEINKNN